MTTPPILSRPNFEEAFTFETCATGDGIGVLLIREDKPIAFMSKALGVSKQGWQEQINVA